MDVSIGDPRKIRDLLGFRATVSLREGLAKTLAASLRKRKADSAVLP
ncbi:MAG: hypothetical protein ACREFB_06445 [Stellaceae bacterium]